MKRLEIGPGEHPLGPEWDTLDCCGEPTIKSEWGKPLPISDGVYDECYSSHCIEHVPWYQVTVALAEVFRVLKPGGTFEVHTVDFGKVARHYSDEFAPDRWDAGGLNRPFHWMRWISGRVFAYEKDGQQNWHRSLFDYDYLRDCLREAGFVNIEDVDEPRGREKHANINLGMRCRKP